MEKSVILTTWDENGDLRQTASGTLMRMHSSVLSTLQDSTHKTNNQHVDLCSSTIPSRIVITASAYYLNSKDDNIHYGSI